MRCGLVEAGDRGLLYGYGGLYEEDKGNNFF